MVVKKGQSQKRSETERQGELEHVVDHVADDEPGPKRRVVVVHEVALAQPVPGGWRVATHLRVWFR